MLEYASMRIIGGRFKGKKLLIPNADTTRPTADLVKTSLFNILQWQIEGAKVLDLFAGSGALGLEAISRNAELAYLIEKNKETFKILQKNADLLRGDIKTLNLDFVEALQFLASKKLKFDLIFLDPPYNSSLEIIALDNLYKYELLEPNSTIVIEQDAINPNNYSNLLNFEIYDIRKYGRKKLYFLHTKENN